MHISMGMDSKKFMREAYRATLRAAAFCSSVAGTIPRIFFWLGQMSTQTLNNMMVPSHAPTPMARTPGYNANAFKMPLRLPSPYPTIK